MLKQRVMTAAVLLAILVAVLLAPRPEFFGALTLVFVAVGGWEWSRLNGVTGLGAYALGALVGIVCAVSWYFNLVNLMPHGIWFGTAGLWLVGAPLLLKGGSAMWLAIPQPLRWVLGIFVLCMAWSALWAAKLMGNNFLLSVLFLVWMADSGAYFGGKKFGKRKLAPTISPGKSWEGALSGMIAVFLMATAWIVFDVKYWFPSDYALTGNPSIFTLMAEKWSWYGLLSVTLLLGVMSVVGDLLESLMKRSVGIKDSSQILPGHGGILDRTDALLPVLPIAIALILL